MLIYENQGKHKTIKRREKAFSLEIEHKHKKLTTMQQHF